MSVNAILKSALESIAPVEADTYEGDRERYITIAYNTIPVNFGDDEPEHEKFLIAVHYFAPIGYNSTKDRAEVKKALVSAGTTWPSLTNISDKFGQHLVFECELVREAGVE
ncbi:MAG: hypothetical protein J1E06_05770 [Acutalibacter sp.]|nr:hypothetical protein [Acutalibacter sp.]